MSRATPGGSPPPATARVGMRATPLRPVASVICERYFEEFPDHLRRYGRTGLDVCRDGNQWLLAWAAQDVLGATDLCEQARWLARVLEARGVPSVDVVRDLQIAAAVASEGAFADASELVAERLRAAADAVALASA